MNPLLNELGTVFIPVKDVEKARDWYCDLLGVPADGEVLHGHLYVLPMKGTGIVLDSKIYAEEATFKVPAFHFNTKDIEGAYQFMKEKQMNLLTDVENGHWFKFTDLDGNVLMVCEC
ncbi:VOC family protein [Halobacillus sp. Marseille-Q1614]|uniref:VOC family protein n=1 Tax=Halobacillus sp. Marseille-Q1614 TaxID=2709134 RepID=UPI00156F7E55|nr:VOC family protein [Halobacillus sp. Marseille-Q1614]